MKGSVCTDLFKCLWLKMNIAQGRNVENCEISPVNYKSKGTSSIA